MTNTVLVFLALLGLSEANTYTGTLQPNLRFKKKAMLSVRDINAARTSNRGATFNDEASAITAANVHLNTIKADLVAANNLITVTSISELATKWGEDKPDEASGAEAKLQAAGCRGFTGNNQLAGKIVIQVANAGVENHDVVHELVHVLSGDQGSTDILTQLGDNGNEGFTEYYARKFCKERGVEQMAAYPAHYSVIASVCTKFPADCWKAYMQNGGWAGIEIKIADAWSKTTCAASEMKSGIVSYALNDGYEESRKRTFVKQNYLDPVKKFKYWKFGWCKAIGDTTNGICNTQCTKEAITVTGTPPVVNENFKYCTIETEDDAVTGPQQVSNDGEDVNPGPAEDTVTEV